LNLESQEKVRFFRFLGTRIWRNFSFGHGKADKKDFVIVHTQKIKKSIFFRQYLFCMSTSLTKIENVFLTKN